MGAAQSDINARRGPRHGCGNCLFVSTGSERIFPAAGYRSDHGDDRCVAGHFLCGNGKASTKRRKYSPRRSGGADSGLVHRRRRRQFHDQQRANFYYVEAGWRAQGQRRRGHRPVTKEAGAGRRGDTFPPTSAGRARRGPLRAGAISILPAVRRSRGTELLVERPARSAQTG